MVSVTDRRDYMEALRNEVSRLVPDATVEFDTTPLVPEMEGDPERFKLYRLCACSECGGTGKSTAVVTNPMSGPKRCIHCRGEGRALQLVATCGSPEAVGVALVTLGREGEWKDCPVGVLDSAGLKNEKWLVSPWLASPRNISDAGRLLATQRKR